MGRKLTYEKVKDVFDNRGYTLLSSEYVDNTTKLDYKCPRGHLGSMIYNSFHQNRGCPICDMENRKPTYSKVKQYFKDRGYTLFSMEYRNNNTKLEYKCPRGHLGAMTYRNFQQGGSCPVCSIEDRRLSYEEVERAFADRRYKLLSTEYVNCFTKLDYRCPRGHLGAMFYNCFQQGCSCPVCSVEDKRHSYDEVERAFADRGYRLLSTDYLNSKTKLEYRCPKGHLGSMIYGSFQQSSDCPICSKISFVSKVSQKWLDCLGLAKEMGISREANLQIGDHRFRVDGFDSKTSTVYEFLGDYWHGNPSMFKLDDMNDRVGKSFGQLYQETIDRIKLLEDAGYKVVYIWEKDFREQELMAGKLTYTNIK